MALKSRIYQLFLLLCTAAVFSLAVPAFAAPVDGQAGAALTGPNVVPPAPPVLEPPKATTATTVAYPDQAPKHTDPVVVRIKILVGSDGVVKKVNLISPPQPIFDEAVVAAAKGFHFQPATYGGKPVPVEISFTHTFLPPPPPAAPPPDGGPPLITALRGKLVEKGTRAPLTAATVTAIIGEKKYTVEADQRGRFRLPLPAGEAKIVISASGFKAFVQREVMVPQQEVGVAYYVERERYDPYEIVVYGEKRREELSRITLRGAEIKQVPGTFGDPFRVIQTLPGVSSIISLLPFPVVRGASPGSTGYLVDGERVPLLYHLLAGPSVIHPEFIDEVQFYPGGAPVTYGGYTAGIIDGKTRRARSDEQLTDVDANLLQAGGLIRRPIPAIDATATAAARVGYPGMILSLATDQASLSYWDYQFRLDGGNPRKGWTLFAYGARDEVDGPAPTSTATNVVLQPILTLSFHRLDLRAYYGQGAYDATFRLIGGLDGTDSGGQVIDVKVLEPSARVRVRQSEKLDLVAGLEGSLKDYTSTIGGNTNGAPTGITALLPGTAIYYQGGALAEALWRPGPKWLIRPGVRGDAYYDGTTTLKSADPRLAVRYKIGSRDLPDAPTASDDKGIWLKAGLGVYHQPPRLFLPVPGYDVLPLRFGLLRAIQSSFGAEIPVTDSVQFNIEAFYNDMNPVVFDFTTNASNVNKAAVASLVPSGTVSTSAQDQSFDRLLTPQQGRAYGLETLLRRQSKNGLYGWISYTLSQSLRLRDNSWVPYDYDRLHLLNLVAGLPLPRNWDIGARLQYQSGKPTTTTAGYNTARTDGYFRLDVRIDKRAVWNKWLFDFYVDLTNVALFPEEIVPGATIRYVLPTIGVRGRL